MKRILITLLVGFAWVSTAQAQTAAPAKSGLASEQNPFATDAKPAAGTATNSSSVHTTLASDSPTPPAEAGNRPTTAPVGQAAGSPAPASPPSLADLPSNQGLH